MNDKRVSAAIFQNAKHEKTASKRRNSGGGGGKSAKFRSQKHIYTENTLLRQVKHPEIKRREAVSARK